MHIERHKLHPNGNIRKKKGGGEGGFLLTLEPCPLGQGHYTRVYTH